MTLRRGGTAKKKERSTSVHHDIGKGRGDQGARSNKKKLAPLASAVTGRITFGEHGQGDKSGGD